MLSFFLCREWGAGTGPETAGSVLGGGTQGTAPLAAAEVQNLESSKPVLSLAVHHSHKMEALRRWAANAEQLRMWADLFDEEDDAAQDEDAAGEQGQARTTREKRVRGDAWMSGWGTMLR